MIDYQHLMTIASLAAETAANEWLANAKPKYAVSDGFTGQSYGTLLDNCGNASLCVKGNTALGKWAKSQNCPKYSHGYQLPIRYTLQRRQEHGLHVAAMKAAMAVVANAGHTGLKIWDYID